MSRNYDLPPSGGQPAPKPAPRTEPEPAASSAAAPRPDAEPWHPFPIEALPEPMRSFVRDGARAIGCDPSYVALPLLSATASAVGNTRRIEIKRGWTEPAIVWTVIVGESGTYKTPAFRLVLKPMRDLQGKRLQEHAAAMAEHEAAMLRYEKELAAWKRSKQDDIDPPEKPQAPLATRYVVSDTTVEALAPILAANPRGVLLARDELAGWVGSFDRYSAGGGGADEAHWLSMHCGEGMVVDRKTGAAKTTYVPMAAVSLCGGIQPRTLDRAMGSAHRESGLLARLLLAYPPRKPRRWTEADVDPRHERAITRLYERLHELDFDHDEDENPRPAVVRMTPAAKDAWVDYFTAHAAEQDGLTGDLAAAWSKLEGYTARLSLVIHCVRVAADDPTLADPHRVDAESIRAGAKLCGWFCGETRRVYAAMGETDEERDRRRLVELVGRRGGCMTVRDLMRCSRGYPTTDEAELALDELVKAGWGRWDLPRPGPRGGQPSKRFVLATSVDSTLQENPVDTVDSDNTPAEGVENGGSVSVNTVNAPETQAEPLPLGPDHGLGRPNLDDAESGEWEEI